MPSDIRRVGLILIPTRREVANGLRRDGMLPLLPPLEGGLDAPPNRDGKVLVEEPAKVEHPPHHEKADVEGPGDDSHVPVFGWDLG